MSAISQAATQAGLASLGPYGAAAGIGLQLFGALTRKDPEPAVGAKVAGCGKDDATGDPCSQPIVDAQSATTEAVNQQTAQLLDIERQRLRDAQLNNRLLEGQLQLSRPRNLNEVLATPQAGGGGQVVVNVKNVNVTDPDDAIEKYISSDRGEQVVLNKMMDNQGSVRDVVA